MDEAMAAANESVSLYLELARTQPTINQRELESALRLQNLLRNNPHPT
jgi:hypothetical protein